MTTNRLRERFALRAWQRHSLVLAVAGTVYVLIGASYILADTDHQRHTALRVALYLMPLDAWGWIWVLVGCLAIMSARWPPASETWGYTTMTSLSAGWASFYGLGIVFGAPIQGLTGVLVWGLMAFLWWAISGLVNPVRRS